MLARDRLLARIAALGEADVRLVEPGLRRKDRVVELVAPARDARLDAPALDVFLARLVARLRRRPPARQAPGGRRARATIRVAPLRSRPSRRNVRAGAVRVRARRAPARSKRESRPASAARYGAAQGSAPSASAGARRTVLQR